jgi:hypothetical protein
LPASVSLYGYSCPTPTIALVPAVCHAFLVGWIV